jgi:hypothetical protein
MELYNSMAMITCKECTGAVSDTAMSCPACGVQLRKPKRTIFGQICKWIFIAFNALMIVWLFLTTAGATEATELATSQAARDGIALGLGMAMTMIGTIWAIGDVILGMFVMFTRAK